MASQIETKDTINTETFLKSNGLPDLIPAFKNAIFEIEDLMMCTESDIRTICDEEFKLKTTQKMRLLRAIQSLPSSKMNQPQTIVITEKEKQLLDKMYQRTDSIFSNIKQAQTALCVLDKSSIECIQGINDKYNEMVLMLDNHRRLLLNTVNTLKEKRKIELQKYINGLKTFHDFAVQSSKACMQIATKCNTLKLQKMEEIDDKYHNEERKVNIDINVEGVYLSNYALSLKYNQETFQKNLSMLFNVSLDPRKLELNPIKVSWKFQQVHKCFNISNNGLTVSTEQNVYGTILFGEFMESGFFAIEYKIDKGPKVRPCIIGKMFKTWSGFETDEDWLCVDEDGTIYGKHKHSLSTKSDSFSLTTGDIVSIALDLENHLVEIKNKTKHQFVAFEIGHESSAIALYCNSSQATIINQTFYRADINITKTRK